MNGDGAGDRFLWRYRGPGRLQSPLLGRMGVIPGVAAAAEPRRGCRDHRPFHDGVEREVQHHAVVSGFNGGPLAGDVNKVDRADGVGAAGLLFRAACGAAACGGAALA